MSCEEDGCHHGQERPRPVIGVDPVCGMEVDLASADHSHEHGGQAYYFCSAHCHESFRADPDRYLTERGGDVGDSHRNRPSGADGIHTCPMHPEVRNPGPGDCPDCGMALEPLVETAPETQVEYVCPMHPEVLQLEPGDCPKCGMALEPRTVAVQEVPNPELTDMTRRFWTSLVLSLPVFVLAMGEMIPGQPLVRLLEAQAAMWTQFVLATPVVLWAGRPFFIRGWNSLLRLSPNMFTLIAGGVGASYGYSVVATLTPRAAGRYRAFGENN